MVESNFNDKRTFLEGASKLIVEALNRAVTVTKGTFLESVHLELNSIRELRFERTDDAGPAAFADGSSHEQRNASTAEEMAGLAFYSFDSLRRWLSDRAAGHVRPEEKRTSQTGRQ